MKIAFFENNIRWNQAVLRAFKRTEHEIVRIPLADLSMQQILAKLDSVKPDLCYVQNIHLSDPLVPGSSRTFEDLEAFFAYDRVPMAIWYLDNPDFQGGAEFKRWWSEPRALKNHLFFVNDKKFLDFFSRRNLSAIHLPIGVDRDLLYSKTNGSFKRNLSFTGAPLVEPTDPRVTREDIRLIHADYFLLSANKLLSDSLGLGETESTAVADAITPDLDQFFSQYYCTPQEYSAALTQFFTRINSKLEPRIMDVLKANYQELSGFYSWSQLTCYLREITAAGLTVNGSPAWKFFFPEQTEAPRFLEWTELFQSYRESKINFCFTKWSLPTATHDRVYEVLMSGGFPLTDYRESLEENFNSGEIAFYRTIDDAKELIAFYLKNDSAREDVRARGQQRVFESHTYDHRLPVLIEKSKSFFGI